ncbi:MAG: glycosyltransferase [Leptolyngbyaceae cyanobacterium MO_188.B28]|nr:glycosyltransferase [Leptolyngbyaceae cyanobacterium MO_188.B28]
MICNDFASVIIPTRNRSVLLEKVLRSLLSQSLSSTEFEVIIVDNGSTDNTRDVVEAFIPLLPNLRYIYEPHPGLHAGRHRGFQEAQSNILVYADDDIEAFPTWLETIKACFKEDVAMVGGKNLPKFEIPPPDWLLSMWQPNAIGEQVLWQLSILNLGDQPKSITPNFIFGCNFAIRRSVLESAGGFHPDSMPQELIRYRGDGESHVSQYVQANGYQALYHPEASVYHWVSASRMTIKYFCRRAYNQGISDSYTQLRKDNRLSPQLVPGPTSSTYTEHIPVPIKKLRSLYRRLRGKSFTQLPATLLRKIRSIEHPASATPITAKLDQIQRQIYAEYHAGYAFHQQAVVSDPTLLTWILKPDYWDYRLPEPS